ncbi:MAG: hypothetical protein HOG79_07350, partial [Prolixibacteraceae bacterium]|nr:hypothetical protein [Prolixibacteraceae bacterium]
MPLGLLNLTTFLKSGKNHIKIYEPKFRLIYNENYKNTAADILKAKPNLIGFSTWCIAYPISLLIAKAIKSIDPKVPIIFGGPQASILANETLANFPFIDFVLKGEADLSFPLFIEELWKPNPNFASISGLVYRDLKGNILNNKLDRQTINLDNLPFPSYDVVPKSKIFKLDVGRGCPFKCTYCSTNDFFSKIYRVKSANRIVAEMTTAFEEMKITNFSFAHDMFTLNKKFILELCNKLINLKKENNIKFIWTCSARIDCVTNEMLIQMQKAGCQSIFFGI